jgi:CRP-like cAMP-binding protein
MSAPLNLIRQIPFFQDLMQSDLEAIAAQAQVGIAKVDQQILAAGVSIQFLSFVLAGELQISEVSSQGRILSIQNIGPGEILGLTACLDSLPSTHTAHTLKETHLLLVPAVYARQLFRQRAVLAERAANLTARALRRHLQERAALANTNAFQRLFAQIELLTNLHGLHKPPIPRQQDLAHILNISRETVSRGLQILIKNGIATKNGHQLKIEQPQLLSLLAMHGIEALETSEMKNEFTSHHSHSTDALE